MKRIAGIFLALSLLLSSAAVPVSADNTVSEEPTKMDITQLPGLTEYWKQDFPTTFEVDTQITAANSGFKSVGIDGGPAKFTIADDDKTLGQETSNKVMKTVPTNSKARPTEAQYNAIKMSQKTVTFDGGEYKIALDGEYYIGLKNSAITDTYSTDKKNSMVWFSKSTIDSGTTSFSQGWTGDGTTCGVFFEINADGTVKGPANTVGSSSQVTFPSEDGAKTYAYQFKFSYPDNGNAYSDENITFDFDGAEFMLLRTSISAQWYGADICKSDGTNGKAAGSVYVPKKDGLSDYVTVSTDLEGLPRIDDKEWHTVMIYVDESNENDKWYTIYYDGLPVYFTIADNGGFGCKIKKHTGKVTVGNSEKEALTAPVIVAGRGSVLNDHAPMYDDFYVYTKAATDDEVAQAVLDGITAPYIDTENVITADLVLDPFESFEDKEITWSLLNEDGTAESTAFTAENTLSGEVKNAHYIWRYNAPIGWGTSKVTLRASYTYGTATKTKDFKLTVKDRAPYEIDTVTMKDSNGNVIYRPLDDSKIESVSYTKNDTSASDAEMYLAVYDSEKRLVSCKKGTTAGNKVTFDAGISRNQTYKVFVWDNGMKPLAEQRTGEITVSEQPTVFVMGDSIAETYSETNWKRGFGQVLQNIFDTSKVTVDNSQSQSGYTTKTMISEGHFANIMNKAKNGDCLFIMLGHNDEKRSMGYQFTGVNSMPTAATKSEYKALLTQMINTAKEKGVTTVLLTPLARPQFYTSSGEVKEDVFIGSHDDSTPEMKAVAAATGCVLIDIDTISSNVLKNVLESSSNGDAKRRIAELGYYGYTDSTEQTLDTHTTEKGANWVAGMIKDELKKSNHPLADFLKTE